MLRARDLAVRTRVLSARDALHEAVMVGQGISRIMSVDADFDRVPGIVRIK